MATAYSPYLELLNRLQSYKDGDGQSYPRIAELVPIEDSICDIDLNSRTIALPEEKYALTSDITYKADKVYYHKVVDNDKVSYVSFRPVVDQLIKDDNEPVYERYSGFLSVQFEHNAEIIYFRCARYFQHMDLAQTVCIVEFVNAHGDTSLYWVPFYDINHYSKKSDGTEEPVIIFPWAINGLATEYEGEVTFTVRFYQLNNDGSAYNFNMSMQPTTGKVLHGMDFSDIRELDVLANDPDAISQLIAALSRGLEEIAIYWTEAE